MSSIKITPHLFEAFLKCSTKCWLRSSNEPETNNAYAEWFKAKSDSYRIENAKRMLETTLETERVVSPDTTKLRTAGWRLAATVHVRTPDDALLHPSTSKDKTQHKIHSESYIHAVERIPSEGRGKPAQFIPIRFIFTNKLGKDDKLLLAFDALVLSQVLGREVNFGKIVYGDDRATIAVKTLAMSGAVQKHLDTITTLLGSLTPPDVVLVGDRNGCETSGIGIITR
jgi:hypothetical protein